MRNQTDTSILKLQYLLAESIWFLNQVDLVLNILKVRLAWKFRYAKDGPDMVKTLSWYGHKNGHFINMSLAKSLENIRALASQQVKLGK